MKLRKKALNSPQKSGKKSKFEPRASIPSGGLNVVLLNTAIDEYKVNREPGELLESLLNAVKIIELVEVVPCRSFCSGVNV